MRSSIVLPSAPVARHRWLLRPRPDASQESTQVFLDTFAQFAVLGSAGAFAAHDVDNRRSAMRILGERRWADGSVEVLVDVVDCDPRYARVLRNVVFGTGEMIGSAALEFHVEPERPGAGDRELQAEVDADAVLADGFYPEISVLFAPIVRRDEPSDSLSARRVCVVGQRDLPPPLINDLVQLAGTWGSVLMTGFPVSEDELRNGRTVILNVQGGLHDEITFEVLIDRFVAAEAALDSLMNLVLTRVSLEMAVVEAVVE